MTRITACLIIAISRRDMVGPALFTALIIQVFRHGSYGYRDPFYDPFYGSGFGSRFGNNFDYREITRYRASAEVKFARGGKPMGADNAFNAQEVLDNLGSKIVYPEVKA